VSPLITRPSSFLRLAREPLAHFLLIGAALFLFFGLTEGRRGKANNRIVVSPNQVEQLAAQFSRTWMRPPTKEEMAGLIANHVRDEVYYREALAMGLDQNDLIIRRRMRQQLEFILEDLSGEEAPSDEALTAFLGEHPEKFRVEPQISFRQLYLNPGKRKDLAADARIMLASLSQGAAPESVGDPTMIPFEFKQATKTEIVRSFGEEFAQEVVKLAPGNWTGPVYSGLGGHLVLVTERTEGRLPVLAEVRALVEREYLAQRRQELKDKAYSKLLEGYQVIIEAPKAAGNVAANGSKQARQ